MVLRRSRLGFLQGFVSPRLQTAARPPAESYLEASPHVPYEDVCPSLAEEKCHDHKTRKDGWFCNFLEIKINIFGLSNTEHDILVHLTASLAHMQNI